VKKKGDNIRDLERNLDENNKILVSLDSEIKNLEKMIDKNKQESQQHNKLFHSESLKNKELAEACSLTEAKIRCLYVFSFG
jgi:hypothetical protein